MTKRKTTENGSDKELQIVKTAGYKVTKRVKKDKTVNRRAGLKIKNKNQDGAATVKRRKPLALKHVRRMRKAGAVASLVAVAGVAAVGVGFFAPKVDTELDKDFQTVCYEVPADAGLPTDHTLIENVGYMNYVLQNQQYWSSEMFSTVHAMGFTQTVETYKQYYEDILISADIAKGFSQKATQFCVTDEVILWRASANTNFDKMNTPWSSGDAQGMTLNNFKKKRGFPPSEFSVYVLNESTVKNAQDYTVTDNGDGTYSMKLDLYCNTGVDETCADYYYKLQMKVTGDLYDCTVIESTSVTYTFDSDWRVLSFKIEDKYVAPIAMGVNIGCSSETSVTFDYGEKNAANSFWNDYFKAQYDRLKDTLTDGGNDAEENTDNALGYLAGAFTSVLTEGAIFKLDLSFDELSLDGVVCIDMDGDGMGVTAKLGDILVWLGDGNTLYINDGVSKYKLCLDGLGSSGSDAQGLGDAFSVTDIMDQLTAGVFTVDEATGIATLQSELDLFGIKISLFFEFGADENGIALNYVDAEIHVGDKTVKARLAFGEEKDRPVTDSDLSAYTDILNDGVSFNVNLKSGEFNLTGIAKIYLDNGKFTGMYVQLGDIAVFYDCPLNMLYFTEGSVRYKLDLNAVSAGSNGGANLSSVLDKLNISSVLKEVISNLAANKDGVISTGFALNIEQLKTALDAEVGLKIKGGLGVDLSLNLDGKEVSFSAGLTNEQVALPDFTQYDDILNSEISVDLKLTLLTNNDKDKVDLQGKATVCLSDGKLSEIRADFGGLAVYYEVSSETFYIKLGQTKVMVDLGKLQSVSSQTALLTADKNIIAEDIPAILSDLLKNLVTESKLISSNTNLTVLDAVIPLSASVSLDGGLKVNAEAVLLGINVNADLSFSQTSVQPLGEEDKAEYINVLEEADKLLNSIIGDRISANVSGTLYSYDSEKYANYGYVKYNFEALLEFERPEISDEVGSAEEVLEQITSDDSLYIHLNISLNAKSPEDDSLYFDFVLMNANPVSGADGRTTGGYTTPDNILDVFVSVSKNGVNPLKIYAPSDEILNIVSMLGATLNLKGLNCTDKDVADAIGQIAVLLDEMLIDKCLPDSVQDKFASLGESLIPQILGVSIQDLLDKLVADADKEIDKAESRKFLLSDKFVQSITNSESNLKIVLNSSLIYGVQIPEEDYIVINFNRVLDGGIYYVDSVKLDNVYFGENNINKLNIGMNLGYGEITKPDSATGLKGYLNASGLDGFLNALVNAATHKTTEEEKAQGVTSKYSLNKNYYIAGDVTLGLGSYAVKVNVKGLSITINDDNSVDFDVSYRVNKLALAVSDNTDVDLSVRGDMMYIRRTVGSNSVTRIMKAEDFAKNADALKDNLNFMFNFSGLVSGILNMSIKDDSLNNKTEIEFGDYGDYLSKFLTKYAHTVNSENNGVWSLALNGETLGKMAGVSLSDVAIDFYAKPTDEGYVLKSLTLNGSLFGVISFKTIGEGLVLCNPADSDFNGEWMSVDLKDKDNKNVIITVDKKLTHDLSGDSACGVNGYSWSEILGGETFGEIEKHVDWRRILSDLGKGYLEYSDGCSLGVTVLKYEYPVGGGFEEFGQRQLVIYNRNNSSAVYSYLSKPSLSEIPKIENKTAVWSKSYISGDDGSIILRVVYETTYKVTVFSDYKTNSDYIYSDGVYSFVEPEAYGSVLLPKDVLITQTESGNVYRLKGYRLGSDSALYAFGSTEMDANGNEYFVAQVNGDMIFTAVWERVYAVKFVSETDGTESVVTNYYYCGETLTDSNMPEVPVRNGYTGSWGGAAGVVIAEDTEYVFKAEYEIRTYSITLSSKLEVTDAGFIQTDGGNYEYSAEYVFGDSVKLTAPVCVSSAYKFGGYYSNADFAGEAVTELVAENNVTYYAKWLGKNITVNYISDVELADGKQTVENGETVYVPSGSTVWTYGKNDSLLIPEGAETDKSFLGWFMQDGANYKYCASAEDIKNLLETNGIEEDSTSITLRAVWYVNAVSGEITYNSYKYKNLFRKEWKIEGYVNSPFVGKSAEIVNACDAVSVSVQLKYGISQDGVSLKSDLNYNKWENANADGTFAKTVSSTNGTDKGSYSGGEVKVSISLNGVGAAELNGGLWKQYEIL